jgi:hypothetical protein
MKDAKFAYTAPAMDELNMSADADCACMCAMYFGSGEGK